MYNENQKDEKEKPFSPLTHALCKNVKMTELFFLFHFVRIIQINFCVLFITLWMCVPTNPGTKTKFTLFFYPFGSVLIIYVIALSYNYNKMRVCVWEKIFLIELTQWVYTYVKRICYITNFPNHPYTTHKKKSSVYGRGTMCWLLLYYYYCIREEDKIFHWNFPLKFSKQYYREGKNLCCNT